jgi:hypothetical protein
MADVLPDATQPPTGEQDLSPSEPAVQSAEPAPEPEPPVEPAIIPQSDPAPPQAVPAVALQSPVAEQPAVVEEPTVLEEPVVVAQPAVFAEPAPPALIEPEPLPELDSSTTLAPSPESEPEEGGEWHLLLAKVRDWLASGRLQSFWDEARSPLTLVLLAAALLLVLRIYTALLSAIEGLPLIPGLLELVGLVWGIREGLPRLLQRSRRDQLFTAVQQRWQGFRGQR